MMAAPDTDFQIIYRANFWRVKRYLGRRFGLSDEDAADVTQEVFLTAHLNFHKFTYGRVFTWLCSIAIFKVKDFYKKNSTYSKYISLLREDSAGMEPVDPMLQIEAKQVLSAVKTAVEGVHPISLEIFERYIVDGAQPSAIAKDYDISSHAVKMRVYRVRKQLNAVIGNL